MKITPRANEVAAVMAVLEDPSHADAKAAAKAVIKAVMAEVGKRDMTALAWRTGPGAPVVAWGPFASQTDVKRFAATLGTGGEALGVTLFSPVSVEERAAQNDEPRSGLCTTCNHPFGTHKHEKRNGVCQIKGCPCTYLTK